MANPTTNYGFVMPSPTDLVTDLPADFDVFGQAVDTQMLTNANAAIAKTIVDAKGDLISATAADTPARLAVGTNGQILQADSTTATGLKWAAPTAGKILQCISTTKADTFSSSSTSYVDVTSLSVSITPSSASNTILVIADVTGNGSAGLNIGAYQLVRGTTAIATPTSPSSRTAGFGAIYINDGASVSVASVNFIDSPATTSATTYKIQAKAATTGTVYVNRSQTDTDNASYIRSVSSITVMEISA